jgi:hypothetical protein
MWSFQQAEKHVKAGLTGAKDTPRWRTFKQVLDVLYVLADEKGVSAFKGDKLKALLNAAARDNEWYARSNYDLPPANAPEGHKVCRRCHEPKPLESFNAHATAAQKARNGWNLDAQYFTVSLLCSVCRPLKQKAKVRAEQRKAAKNSPFSIVDLYRKGISTNLVAVVAVLRSHTHDLGGYKDVQFTHAGDRQYYETRMDYLRRARQRLNDRIDEGSLSRYAEGEKPPVGVWQELLTAEERDWLATLYRQGSWAHLGGFKGKQPRLWDSVPEDAPPTAPRRQDTAPKAEVPAAFIVPTPEKPTTDWSAIPWEDM